MALVESLLTAIARADGDALVMHVGEKPYVVASAGPIELSTHGLNLEAMAGMLNQLLPADSQRALAEFGAVEHELQSVPAALGDRFTVVAARGGDDVWIELRRHRRPRQATIVPVEPMTPPKAEAEPVAGPVPAAVQPESVPQPVPVPVKPVAAELEQPAAVQPEPVHAVRPDPVRVEQPAPVRPAEAVRKVETPAAATADPRVVTRVSEVAVEKQAAAIATTPARRPAAETPASGAETGSTTPVIPMTRTLRIEVPARTSPGGGRQSGIERLLALAAGRGASALHLTSQSRPFLRVDGDIRAIENEPPLTGADIEAAVLELVPENVHDAVRRGEPAEWESDLPEIGRVRGATFRDYRGAGAIFQLISARPLSAEQLGLTVAIQGLATEAEGLVLVASPRGAGKSSLAAGLIDVINRERPGYVITLERQIRVVHETRVALVSQREARGSAEQVSTLARAALRENPDVLVIDDLPSPEIYELALDAAGTGLLVLVTVTANSASEAVARVLDVFPADRRAAVQIALADRLRGSVAQVLLRKSGGGRIAARELLLTTSAVAGLLSNGQLEDLPLAIEGSRKHGMAPLNDDLVAFVSSGAVDVREAYRKTDDRDGLLAALKRDNVDTAFLERLA